ncbi:ComEC/Rec2 family competence protein [Caenimonas sedimenti]|nr:MBL fold metallo-hydrolase [Caenimonas sedimenti]
MKLEIFDVGHGACALLSAAGYHVMIDCASSVDLGFDPGGLLVSRGITTLDLLIVTNYDEDHVRGLPKLLQKVDVDRIRRNRKVTPDTIDELKGLEPGPGIAALIDMAKEYTVSVNHLEIPDVTIRTFSHAYPDFEDENNLSLVTVLELGAAVFVFPGDMECDGWEALLDAEPDLCGLLKRASVYVASHHGRVSGICERIFDEVGCSPHLVVISDKGYLYDTQETVPYYRTKAGGWTFRNTDRWVLTTRSDGMIEFEVGRNPNGRWYLVAR